MCTSQIPAVRETPDRMPVRNREIRIDLGRAAEGRNRAFLVPEPVQGVAQPDIEEPRNQPVEPGIREGEHDAEAR